MEYNTFKMELLELVQRSIGENTKVSIERIPKNNGILLDGMVFYSRERNVTPVVYLEEFYEYWKNGTSMAYLVDKILEGCKECAGRIVVDEGFFESYEELKPHIYYKLINYEKNKETLRQMPHRRILDLAMVFYYRMEEVEPMATIMIQNNHLMMWGITAEELEKNACKYTYLDMPAIFMTMQEVMQMDEWEEEENFPMYVLTNQEKQFGAGVILYPGILKQAEALLGENFYILPSSVHECILIPEETMYTQKELARMVAEINRDHVDPREILSNQAYFYAKKSGRIEW